MKKFWTVPILLICLILVIKFWGEERSRAQDSQGSSLAIALEVDKKIAAQNVNRIGINLGRWTSSGSPQYSKNVLMNPGFEGRIDRILVIVTDADNASFSDEAGWGYPDNYWREAEFDVRTGPSAGKRGVIKKSLTSGDNGVPQYFSDLPLPLLEANNVIALTKLSRPDPGNFWEASGSAVIQLDPYQSRPESPGVQAMRLMPTQTTPAELNFFLDTLSAHTGKMLPVNGPWHFSVWAKAQHPNTDLEVSFQRGDNTLPFFHESLSLTTDWQEYNIDFHGNDQGPPGPLKLSLAAAGPESSVWVDDVLLSPRQKTESSFREEVIHVLQQMKPSFIREFAHIADTFENRIAEPFGRRPWIYRLAGGRSELIYSYSLPELLQLCSLVKANPWIVVPPTFSDYELKQLGQFLAKEATKERFSEVILEFGNENWNWLFRPAAIPYYQEHGEAAKRAFEQISQAVQKKVNARYLVNGQYSVPWTALKFLDYTPNADGLAIAPYFFHSLESGTPDPEALKLLFQDDPGLIKETADEIFARDKMFAIYELNLHTTRGDARAYERNRIVAGAVSGSALAKRIIESLFAGADPIMVYALSQNDSATWDIADFVNLWGVVRDFGPPPVFRPTGLAVTMLNEVVGGEMHKITPVNHPPNEQQKLTMAAFNDSRLWTAAIISESPIPLELEIQFPEDNYALPKTLLILDSKTPFDTNESGENVKIIREPLEIRGRSAHFTVPPWGFVVLA